MTPSEIWSELAAGLGITLALSAASMAAALVLGTIVGVARMAGPPASRALADAYVELFRGVPLLPVLAFIYLGLPKAGLGLESAFASATLGLGLYTAAFVAEAVRGGLLGVPAGQLEAGRALGLTFPGLLRHVWLPQAIRAAIPPLGTVLIALIKNSAVAGAVAVEELVYRSDLITGRTFATWPLLAAFLLYLLLTVPLAIGVNALERRWRPAG
jgi:His/Glu/Gln/Arg/opine family amino acid ABC transporter permease subunit